MKMRINPTPDKGSSILIVSTMHKIINIYII